MTESLLLRDILICMVAHGEPIWIHRRVDTRVLVYWLKYPKNIYLLRLPFTLALVIINKLKSPSAG